MLIEVVKVRESLYLVRVRDVVSNELEMRRLRKLQATGAK